ELCRLSRHLTTYRGEALEGGEGRGIGEGVLGGGFVGGGPRQDALHRHLELLARERAGNGWDRLDPVGHVAGRQLSPQRLGDAAAQAVVEGGAGGEADEQDQLAHAAS